MTIRKEILFLLLFIMLPIIIFIFTIKFERFLPLPMVARQIIHGFFPEKDFNQPILVDNDFVLTEEGFSKEYKLNFKYYDSYWIGVLGKESNIPSEYKFRGVIKVEFFQNNNLISEHVISSALRAYSAGKDIDHIRRFEIYQFQYPINNKFKDDIKLKLTVLKPDLELLPYIDSLQLYVQARGLY